MNDKIRHIIPGGKHEAILVNPDAPHNAPRGVLPVVRHPVVAWALTESVGDGSTYVEPLILSNGETGVLEAAPMFDEYVVTVPIGAALDEYKQAIADVLSEVQRG